MSADLTAADAARMVESGAMSYRDGLALARTVVRLEAERDKALADAAKLRLEALDTIRIRAEHALLVRFAGQPLACGQCGAAVMRGYLCAECGTDPTQDVR